MKSPLPTAVSTGSLRNRRPPGRRIRAISARISALCRTALPGITPDKRMSKLDSLWAAEKKEDANQQPPDPRSNPPSGTLLSRSPQSNPIAFHMLSGRSKNGSWMKGKLFKKNTVEYLIRNKNMLIEIIDYTPKCTLSQPKNNRVTAPPIMYHTKQKLSYQGTTEMQQSHANRPTSAHRPPCKTTWVGTYTATAG